MPSTKKIIIPTRKWTEFVMWNHCFMMFSALRCLYYGYFIFGILGNLVTLSSFTRHHYKEKECNCFEPFIVKFTVLFGILYDLYYLSFYDNIFLLGINCILVSIWKIEQYNEEKIHPWVHIAAAGTTYAMGNCWNSEFGVTPLLGNIF